MLPLLWRWALDLISAEPCPCCRGEAMAGLGFCRGCEQRLGLSSCGMQDADPLPWHALGSYSDGLRQLLLQQRPHPDAAVLQALSTRLASCCTDELTGVLLVPIPSWKRAANPLPLLLARGLIRASGSVGRSEAARMSTLLRRTRPTLGQHHLGRRLRVRNQQDSFAVALSSLAALPRPLRRRPIWLIDDILTTGATALAASAALQQAGLRVRGLLALARTPAASTKTGVRPGTGCDLGSNGRHGDGPG